MGREETPFEKVRQEIAIQQREEFLSRDTNNDLQVKDRWNNYLEGRFLRT